MDFLNFNSVKTIPGYEAWGLLSSALLRWAIRTLTLCR